MSSLMLLKKNNDYRRVYKNGLSVANRYLVLYYLQNHEDKRKFGFSISKKLGKAVVRNRLRRILKEICRHNQLVFPLGRDYVIIARKDAVAMDYRRLTEQLSKLAGKVK